MLCITGLKYGLILFHIGFWVGFKVDFKLNFRVHIDKTHTVQDSSVDNNTGLPRKHEDKKKYHEVGFS